MFCQALDGHGLGMQECSAERPRRVFATCGRGTVAQANLRVAAGIGVAAAFLLAVGPSAAVAVAGPGGSHSGGSDNHDRSGSRGGSDWSDDNVTNGIRGSQRSGVVADSPRTKVGSGRDPGTSVERSGPDYSPDPAGAFQPPKVTFGDGRSPGRTRHRSRTALGGRWRPACTTAATTGDRGGRYRASATPIARQNPPVIRQLMVAPAAELTDPMWGVAGLLLIPAAGAVLGYRQARATQAVAKLGRHP